MRKITLLLFFLVAMSGFSQSKSTPIISLNSEMTAQFTLDNTTSKVTLVLTGPSEKWSSLGLGTTTTTSTNDVYAYTTSVLDTAINQTNANEAWSTTANSISSGVRKVTLERTLSNSDLNDLQLTFDTTSSIDLVWSRSGSAIATITNANRGATTALFTSNLGINADFLENVAFLYPNPTTGELFIKTKTNLSKVNVYSQTGTLVKTIIIKDNSNEVKVYVGDLAKALYFFELQNDSEKSWKKVLVD